MKTSILVVALAAVVATVYGAPAPRVTHGGALQWGHGPVGAPVHHPSSPQEKPSSVDGPIWQQNAPDPAPSPSSAPAPIHNPTIPMVAPPGPGSGSGNNQQVNQPGPGNNQQVNHPTTPMVAPHGSGPAPGSGNQAVKPQPWSPGSGAGA